MPVVHVYFGHSCNSAKHWDLCLIVPAHIGSLGISLSAGFNPPPSPRPELKAYMRGIAIPFATPSLSIICSSSVVSALFRCVMGDSVPIQRPVPRRTFQISSPSAESSAPPTPSPETSDPSYLDPRSNGGIPPSRTRSILNLTSSTLFGIYAPTGYEGTRDDGATPWGTGSQTPAQRKSIDDLRPPVLGPYQRAQVESRQPHHHPKPMDKLFPLALRTVLLFLFGIAYGVIVTHLHDNRTLAPVRVEGIDRYSWRYLMFWGLAGVGLGSLLPWVDVVWEEKVGKPQNSRGKEDEDTKEPGSDGTSHGDGPPASSIGSGLGADWNPVVRSIGAFVGIAFAIVRTLPPECLISLVADMSYSANFHGSLLYRFP